MSIRLNDEHCLLWIKDPSVSPFTNTKTIKTWINHPFHSEEKERKFRKNILSEENIKNPKSFLNKIKRKCFYNSIIRQQIVDKIKEYQSNGTLRLYTLNDKYENAYKEGSYKFNTQTQNYERVVNTQNDKFENIEYTTPPFTREECELWVSNGYNNLRNPRPNETFLQTTKTASTAASTLKIYDKIGICDPTYIELIYTTLQYGISMSSFLNKSSHYNYKHEEILYEKVTKIIKNVLYRLEFMKEIDNFFLNNNIESFDDKLKISSPMTPRRKAATLAAAKTSNIANNSFGVSLSTSNFNSLNSKERRQLRDLKLEKKEEEKLIAIHQYNKGIIKKKERNSSNEIDITRKDIFISFKKILIDLQNAVMKGNFVEKILDTTDATYENDKKILQDTFRNYFIAKGYNNTNIDSVLKENNFDTIKGILCNYINNIFAQLINPSIEELPKELEIGVLSYTLNFFNLQLKIIEELYKFILPYNVDSELNNYYVDLIRDVISVKFVKKIKLDRRKTTSIQNTFQNFYYKKLYLMKLYKPKQLRLPAGKGLLIGKELTKKAAIYKNLNLRDKLITDVKSPGFTYEECKNWVIIPIFNPRTFKKILIDSPIYNTLLVTSYQYDTNLIPRMITSYGCTIIYILTDIIENILNKEKAIAQTREELENFIINNNIKRNKIHEEKEKEKEFIPSKIGLKWKNAGYKKPKEGIQLNELNNILISKGIIADKQPPFYLVFTENELAAAGITTVAKNNYIEIATYYVIDNSPTPQSTPQNTPQNVRSSIPQNTPQNVRSSIPQSISQGVRSSIPQSISQSISQSVRPNIPQSVRPNILQSVRPNIPQSVRPNIPQSVRPNIPQGFQSFHTVAALSERSPYVAVSNPNKIRLKWKKVTDLEEGKIIEKDGIEIKELANNKSFKKAFLKNQLQGRLPKTISFSKEYLATFGATTANITNNSYIKIAYYYKPEFEKSKSDIKSNSNKVGISKRYPEYVAYKYYTIADCLRWARQPTKNPKTQQLILTDSKEYNIIFEQALVYDYNIIPINITKKGEQFMKIILKTIKNHLKIAERKKLPMSRGRNIADINSSVCNTINNIYDDETDDIGKKYKKFKDLMIGKCEQYNKKPVVCIIEIKNLIKYYFNPNIYNRSTEYRLDYYQESALASLLIFYDKIKNKIYKQEYRDIFIYDFNKFYVYIYEINDQLNAIRKNPIDAGGPKREFFTKLFEELFCDDEHPERPFACPPDILGNKYYINPNFKPDANFLKVIAVYNKIKPHMTEFKTERDYEYIYYVIGKLLCLTVYNDDMGLPKQLSEYILAGFINQPNKFDYYDILYFYLKDYKNAVSLLKMISKERINNIEDSYLSFNYQYNISKTKGSSSDPLAGEKLNKGNFIKFILQQANHVVRKNYLVKDEGKDEGKDNSTKSMKMRYKSLFNGFSDEIRKFLYEKKVRIEQLSRLITNEQLTIAILREFVKKIKVMIPENVIINEAEKLRRENEMKQYISNIIMRRRDGVSEEDHLIFIKKLLQYWTSLNYFNKNIDYNIIYMYDKEGKNVQKLPQARTCFDTIYVNGFPDNNTPEEKETFLYGKFEWAVEATEMENT